MFKGFQEYIPHNDKLNKNKNKNKNEELDLDVIDIINKFVLVYTTKKNEEETNCARI